MSKKKIEQTQPAENIEIFERNELITCKRFKRFNLHRDVLAALLSNERYSLDEAEKIIKNYVDSF